jgi:hypothetical protein
MTSRELYIYIYIYIYIKKHNLLVSIYASTQSKVNEHTINYSNTNQCVKV